MENLTTYFEEYSRHAQSGNVKALAEFYADEFMMATLSESSAFKNDDAFLDWLNVVFEFNKKSGLMEMSVVNVTQDYFGENFARADGNLVSPIFQKAGCGD